MSLPSLLLRRSSAARLKEIDTWTEDPFPVQERTLLGLVSKAAGTRYGREHGFSEVKGIEEFQRRVPIGEYLDFKDLWAGYARGERDITWPGWIKYFPITSGTTAGNKLIPLSSEGIESNLKAGKDTLYFYVRHTGDYGLFGGKILYLGGSTDLKPGGAGTLVGDLSAIMNLYVPWYVKPFRTPPNEISFMGNWEEKLQRIVDLATRQDVRGLTGIPSWLLILIERVFEHVTKVKGVRPSTVLDVWPEMRLLVHGGISFEPYRKMFREYFGERPSFLEVYPASEGFIAMQDDLGRHDLLLMCDYGIFYEFVPVARLADASPPRLTVADVKTDVNYAILMSTNSGLWGYLLGDTVRFTSLRPHRLVVTGRTKHFLSAFGEHLIAEEVEEAVTRGSSTFGIEIADFHVAPLLPREGQAGYKPRHQWILEATRAPEGLDLLKLAVDLDAVVRERNDDYAAHRQGDTGLDVPLVTLVPPGTFYETMKRLGKLGGQHKAPRLQNDRGFADDLLAAAESLRGPVQ